MTHPSFFGAPENTLFGFGHPPQKQNGNTAVLLCYPLGQEYIRLYRSYKLIAEQLSKMGAYVFRFDYYGTGDSHGEIEDCKLEDWVDNINAAIEELKLKSGLDSVNIISARLGANLTAKVAKERSDIDNLICLDPIHDGREYVTNLQKTHNAMLCDPDRFGKVRTIDECFQNEIIGFRYSSQLIEEFEGLSDSDLYNANCNNLYLIDSNNNKFLKEIENSEKTSANKCIYNQFDTVFCWSDVSQIETTISLQEIVSYIKSKLIR